jgi:Tol biopolymer transport system component/predicted Ser/Thr protein kinase
MIGRTVTHYEILEKLGEGGMGVVYKAHDTKLDRVVALKFLPHYLTSDPTEKERFYHEARAASALVHANAAVVFEIDEDDGQVFIAMEYVEGMTLKEVIEKEPLTIKQVLDIGIQVSDGLAAAHEKGIVHRDIKSENIIVTGKGQAKITDFGLAKVKGATKLTKVGSTLGTAAYMSPEQARGEEVDHRSDIFSFGVVLYEMLTGRLPFKGEHHAALLYSILNDEQQPIARFNEKVTPEIEHIVSKGLEKDREDRYQHADEVLADLRRERKKIDYVKTGAVAAPAAPKARPSRKRLWYSLGALAVVIIAGATYVFVSKRPPSVALNSNMTFRVLPIPFTEVGLQGLSQDGNWAAFPAVDANGKYDIYFMNTSSGESRRVTADSSAYLDTADLSPDGSQIVYDRPGEGWSPEIMIVSSVGGPSKRIVDRGLWPRWRPDGQRIGYLCGQGYGSQSGKAEFWSVRPNGTDNRRELIDSSGSTTQTRPFSWSPDGRSVCWIHCVSEQSQELVVYELSTGKARQVTFDKKGISDVCWAPNGQIIFSSNKTGNYNLWMVPGSGGEETQITKGAGPDKCMKISRDGSKLLYLQQQSISHIWIAGTDGSNPRQITFDDVDLWRVSFSADGKQILFGFSQPVGAKEGALVCSVDRDGRNRKQLTSGEESINNPIMSPDGRWIIYGRHSLSTASDSSMVYLLDAVNPGTPRRVGRGAPMRWVDEKTFVSWDYPFGSWLCGIDGGTPQKFFEDSTGAIPLQGGKYIGYYDGRAGREGMWICAAAGVKDPVLPSPKKLLSGAVWGEFDKSGRFLYFIKNTGELRRISIPSGKEEVVRGVFPGLNFTGSWLDISYDGKEIVYTDARANSKLVMIENAFK